MVHQYIDQSHINYNNNIHQYLFSHHNTQNFMMDTKQNTICTNNNNNNSIQDKKRKIQTLEQDFNNNNNNTDSIYNIQPPPKFLSFPSINLNPLFLNNLNNINNNDLIVIPISSTSSDDDDNIMMPIQEKKKDFNKRFQMNSKEYRSILPEHDEKSFSEEIKDSLIEDGWKNRLEKEFDKDYFKSLLEFLETEKESGVTIVPRVDRIFRCFNETPFDSVKLVLIGNEPPSGHNQANGLSFSLEEGSIRTLPSSLKNIYTELQNDLGVCFDVSHGNLEKWAKQGVLLLNSTLTVRKASSESHSNKGWEQFTDRAIELLSKERKGLIFLLWGRNTQEKVSLIDKDNSHHILTASHPSPFSALKGFFGCKHFSKSNSLLIQSGKLPIDWELK